MYNVLIADDEVRVCQLIQYLVKWEELGLQVISVVHTGAEALRAVQELQPDIVITDVRMPELSGLELLEKIRGTKADVDFLIISGYQKFEYAKEALRFGAEDYILKPIKEAEINEVLTRIVQKRNKKQEVARNARNFQMAEFAQDVLGHSAGEFFVGSVEDINRKYQCMFQAGFITAAAIKIDITGADNIAESVRIVGKRVCNIATRNLQKEGFYSCWFADEDLLIGIIDGDLAGEEVLMGCLRHVLSDIRSLSDKLIRIHGTVGIGGSGSMKDLYRLVEQARITAWERLRLGRGDLITSEQCRTAQHKEIITIREKQELKNQIESLQNEGVANILKAVKDRIADGIGSYSGMEIFNVYQAMLEILSSAAKRLAAEAHVFKMLEEAHLQLRMCMCSKEMAEYYEKLVNYLLVEIRMSKEVMDKKPIRDAKEYIRQHFSEELTLEKVSEIVQLNPSYFSSIFKGETGESFLEYITKLRMEKAKELLLQPHYTVTEIAWSVGYKDEKYFMRIFKKKMGLTCAQYRKLYG